MGLSFLESMGRMKRLRTLLGIGFGLAVVAGAGWYISQSGSAPPARPPAGRFAAGAAVPVGVATAAKGEIPIVLRALGTVTPLHTVNVKTQITGQLTEVHFKEGQMVKQGDLLAQVDPRPYEVALQQALGQQQRDEALLKNAQMDLERYRKLVQQDSIARQQYDTQMSLVRQYEAALVIDQAQVDAARLNVTYTKIVAPLTGRIGLRMVDKGNYVTMGDASSICVIIQVQPISVLFTIPEDSLPLVRQRLQTGETLEVRVLDRSQKNELAVGRLDTTDNVIDLTTGTVKLRAIFDNADESLFPNQFVNVRLRVRVINDAVVIPAACVQYGSRGTYVYVVNAENQAKVRDVVLGPADGDRQSVASGLAAGEQVVLEGIDRLRDGRAVTLVGADGTAPPAVAGAMRGDKAGGKGGGKGEKSEMSPKGEKGDKSRGKKKEQ